MEEKITLQALAAKLAENTGDTKKQCEDFLREFFTTISETLISGENVKIKGLGVFRIISVSARKSVDVNTGESIEIPAHNKIVFSASKELAEEVNEPFSIFESVEIEDSVADKELEDFNDNENDLGNIKSIETGPTPIDEARLIDSNQSKKEEESFGADSDNNGSDAFQPIVDDHEAEVESSGEKNVEDRLDDEIETDSLNKVISTDETITKQVSDNSPEQEIEEESIDESFEYQEFTSNKRKRRFSFLMGFACGLAFTCIVCLGAWYLYFQDVDFKSIITGKSTVERTTAKVNDVNNLKNNNLIPDSVGGNTQQIDSVTKSDGEEVSNQVSTKPSDMVERYDTISKTRYLTTMAKDYYGNYNLWPYIYEENKAFLGHPDRIKPGTKVVIPPLSKFGVDPKNEDDIKKAKKMGQEIYAKYK